ncbi:hypothetical protein PbJCM13498_01330 [Prolixibacter bellariivorans]|uniref:Thioredoxin n=1 Tax=Prolixibacter bellariivorans TaxID=314319 RepID=A0A5M4ATL1_9BACT|nr:thioredoxin [Prolixibacter bellariivorans]GET31270.1 hypothetical protein PbJCM13498_01330 [Prolixibacter bellariivorans]
MQRTSQISVLMAIFLSLLVSCNQAGNGNQSNMAGKGNEKNLVVVKDMSKFSEIINGDTPVLVDFYADWCAPCKMMAPILEQLSKEMQGSVRVVKVNVDNNREAAMQYGIRNIPTMLLFRNGQIKWQGVGVMQADQLKSIIQQNS